MFDMSSVLKRSLFVAFVFTIYITQGVTTKCTTNEDCRSNEECVNEVCVDVCKDIDCKDSNAKCVGKNHKQQCFGNTGYKLDATLKRFVRELGKPCSTNKDCSSSEDCENGFCVDACNNVNCKDPNAGCRGVDHQPICKCKPGFRQKGNSCLPDQRKPCSTNKVCSSSEECENGFCVDVCDGVNCRDPNAECLGADHQPTCKCKPGFRQKGNSCVPEKRKPCSTKEDCSSSEDCENGFCVDVCDGVTCRDPNAECLGADHQPTCKCNPGFRQKGNSCVPEKIAPKPKKCSTNESCSLTEECLKEICIDVCKTHDCGDPNAVCYAKNHKAKCKCKPGFYRGRKKCKPIPAETTDCTKDSDCKESEECLDGHCINPCKDSDCEDANAECSVEKHKPVCKCKSGFELVNNKCMPKSDLKKCSSDADCNKSSVCDHGACVDLCHISDCGANAWCKVEDHKVFCVNINLPGHDPGRFYSTMALQYQRIPANVITFAVDTTGGHAQLFLSETPSLEKQFLTIIFGSDGNKEITIKRQNKVVSKTTVGNMNIKRGVNSEKHLERWEAMSKFVVKFQGGHYFVGDDKNIRNAYIEWEDPNPFYINYYGIASGQGSTASWAIDGEDYTTPKDDSQPHIFEPITQYCIENESKTEDEVRVILMMSPVGEDPNRWFHPFVEIILGSWNNSASAIRFMDEDKVRVETPSLMTLSRKKYFRICWVSGHIEVRDYDDGKLIMEWDYPRTSKPPLFQPTCYGTDYYRPYDVCDELIPA